MLASYTFALLDAALRGTLLAMLLLLSANLLRERPALLLARAGAVLCVGLAIQVISSTPLFEEALPRLWQAPWVGISVGNAVLFWIFVQALFDDDFVLRRLHGIAWLTVAAASGLNCAVVAGSGSIFAPLLFAVQRGVPVLFALLAALAAYQSWNVDLLEKRRRLRAFILVTGIVYTLLLLLARLTARQGRLSAPTATADVLILLGIISYVTFKMLRLGNLELFPLPKVAIAHVAGVVAANRTVSSDRPVEHDPADEQQLAILQNLMKQERMYSQEDVSLASLAARMQMPEYRLRRLINQRLGFRNFNAYINEFRLAEARAALSNRAQRDLPVLTIALSSGFQSIGPFNRAFKEATGLTPTEFRKENMADS